MEKKELIGKLSNFIRKEKFDAIDEIINKFKDEKNYDMVCFSSQAFINMDEYKEALKILDSIKNEYSENGEFCIRYAMALYNSNREDEALEWFKKAKEKGIKEIDETSSRYYPKSVDDWIKRAGAWAPRRIEKNKFEKELRERILVLDGAMGTVLQKYELTPEDFNGAKGCYEILNETRPDIIFEVHKKYIEAGADIIETNSFNCNAISLKNYNLEDKVYDLAKKSAEIAKDVVRKSGKKVYVFGSVGPTNKGLSFPKKDVSCKRTVSFDEMKEVIKVQVAGLIDGGVDGILLETIFDCLTAKAGLLAIEEVFEEKNIKLPISISATVNKQGKLLTGQSMESLIVDLDRDSVTSFGFNCSFGAKDLVPLVLKIKELTTKFVSLHANAGLPNQNGDYVETAQKMRDDLLPLIENQAINILGGCCGTDYEHIKLIAELVKGKKPRVLLEK